MSDILREAIKSSGLPTLRIADDTGIARASLIRFIRGERSLRLDIADKLAAYFELELNKPGRT
jgi:plasmid maintenance system antidote protein VapI